MYSFFRILPPLVLLISLCSANIESNSSSISPINEECLFYLAPSAMAGAGRGVFAGIDIPGDSHIDWGPTILVKIDYCSKWELFNYVYNSDNEGHFDAPLGMAMMFNHNEKFKQLYHDEAVERKVYAHSSSTDKTNSRTTVPDFNYYSKSDLNISAGDEIFNTYGGTHWFEDRGFTILSPDETSTEDLVRPRHSLEFLKESGQCIGDVYMWDTSIPLASRGLFARRSFKEGEITSMSPALFIPKSSLEEEGGVLINYCFADDNSDIAFFPFGMEAMINHANRSASNIEIVWYDFTKDPQQNLNFQHGKNQPDNLDLFKENSRPSFDFGYRATRDIKRNEELLIYYGESWERAWAAHLASLLLDPSGSPPPFRHPIKPPKGFYPPSWYNTRCSGKTCVSKDYGKSGTCRLYIAPSYADPSRRGVYTTEVVDNDNTLVDRSVAISVSSKFASKWKLNPLRGATDKQSITILAGAGMIIDSRVAGNIDAYILEDSIISQVFPNLTYQPVTQSRDIGFYRVTDRLIQPGDELVLPNPVSSETDSAADSETDSATDSETGSEIVTETGSETLATTDSETKSSAHESIGVNHSFPVDFLITHGQCLTDVYLGRSSFPLAGRGLFASRSFRKGEIVYVSPAYLLPKADLVEEGGVLMNHCISSAESSYALFPLGLSSMINHALGSKPANLKLEWFNWDISTQAAMDIISSASSPSLDKDRAEEPSSEQELSSGAAHRTQYDLAYRTTRDVEYGEELTLDYGDDWLFAWTSFLTSLVDDEKDTESSNAVGANEITSLAVDVNADVLATVGFDPSNATTYADPGKLQEDFKLPEPKFRHFISVSKDFMAGHSSKPIDKHSS